MKNQINAAVRSGCGLVRINNEDAFYFNGCFRALEQMDQPAVFNECLDLENSVFAVCDGVGGHAHGELAAFMAVKRLADYQEQLAIDDFATWTATWIQNVNHEIQVGADGGGCTLALLAVTGNCVRVAHLGDSRVYRWHDGELIRLTRDHSKVQMLMDAGLLTEEQAHVHPQRHMITRYLGMDESENGICLATLERPFPIIGRDRYLLCSDGVTDMIGEAEIRNIFADNASVDDTAEMIYQAALNAGGKDNITLIVLELRVEETRYCLENDDDYEQTDNPLQGYAKNEFVPHVKVSQTYMFGRANVQQIMAVSELNNYWSCKDINIKTEIKSTIIRSAHEKD